MSRLWRGRCKIRDLDHPKTWVETQPKNVEKVHLGLVYWSPSVMKSSGCEYADPRVKYTRLKPCFDTVEAYYATVVGAGPDREWGLYPERCATLELATRASRVKDGGDAEVLMRPKDRILNMFPAGDELSWWLVAEVEPKKSTSLSRRMRDAFPVICKQQVVEGIWLKDDEFFTEFYAMRARARTVREDIDKAFKNVEKRQRKELTFVGYGF